MSEKQVSDLIISIIMVAIMVSIIVDHTAIMPKPAHSCRIRFAGIDSYRQQKKKYGHRAGDGADGMPHRSRAGAKEEEPEPKPKQKPSRRGAGRHPRLPP